MNESGRSRDRERAVRPQEGLLGTWFGLALIGFASAVALGVALLADIAHAWLIASIAASAILLAGLLGALASASALSNRRRHRIAAESARSEVMSALLEQAGPGWRGDLPCYLTVQDENLRILEMNDRFRQDFGEPIGVRCYEAYKDRSEPCPDCPVLRTFADGHTHSSEERVITENGEPASVIVTSVPLRNRRGDLVGVVELSTNTTELETVQRELDRSKRQFERLFDIVPCYISIQDRDFRIVESNELFRTDFGDCSGVRCYEAYKGRTSVCPECPVQQSLADGQVHSSEEEVVTRDGRRAAVMAYSMPIRNDGGEVTAVMEVSANITEVKQLQHQLAMMGLAVAGMAHRIKNILMGLEGGIYIVTEGIDGDDRRAMADGWEMVKRNVDKVAAVVKDLLYCSKFREPSFAPQSSPAAIIGEVHELFAKRTTAEGIELRVDVDEALRGSFDPRGMHSLLSNLVANAIDACRFDPDGAGKKHAITMRCRAGTAGSIIVEVEDNGSGIPTDVHHKVFRGFFSTKGTEGTGLGLLVVQKVIDEHGGTVSFESEEGQGTRFTAEFPAEPVANTPEELAALFDANSPANAGGEQ